ncbi:NAD(P)H-dependent oxidoreductase subunit E, partial [Weissella cibaria]|nr:NAD(P)H-dependent oxidoreductase subunit E [Weissella cibaria]
MADFIKHPVVPLPERDPEPVFSTEELVFTDEEKRQIEAY